MAKGRHKFQSRTKKAFLFEIDGMEFATVRRISGARFVDFIDLAGKARGGMQNLEDVAELGGEIRGMFSSVMEPEEFERFWKWARSEDGTDFETMIEVIAEMVTDDTDRPTGRPASSGRGPRTTGTSSTGS